MWQHWGAPTGPPREPRGFLMQRQQEVPAGPPRERWVAPMQRQRGVSVGPPREPWGVLMQRQKEVPAGPPNDLWAAPRGRQRGVPAGPPRDPGLQGSTTQAMTMMRATASGCLRSQVCSSNRNSTWLSNSFEFNALSRSRYRASLHNALLQLNARVKLSMLLFFGVYACNGAAFLLCDRKKH